MRASPQRRSRIIRCAGRQLCLTGGSCARAMVRSDGVAVATNTSAGEQHDGIESSRRIEPQPHMVEVSLRRPQPRVGLKRSSEPPHRDAVPPSCSPTAGTSRQRAHRAGVRAVRVERAVPGRDAERSERGRRCLGTTSARCIQRVARHVTNRLLTGCGAARGATPSSRRSVRTRSGDPGCLRVRVLAPQSLRRPVPSAVRRITE